jgi:hypothetical protein
MDMPGEPFAADLANDDPRDPALWIQGAGSSAH